MIAPPTPEHPRVKLPPSQRDFEVYEFVAVQCHSTRDAAERFGISQTRVRQVMARVAELLAEAAPEEAEELTKQQRLIAGERLASMRLDHLYGLTMEMWRRSQDDRGLGRVSYLNQALRISLATAKLALRPLPELAEDRIAEDRAAEAAPPVRACSLNSPSMDVVEPTAAQPVVLTLSPDAPCKSLDEIKAAARRDFLRPAQPAEPQQPPPPAGRRRA